MVVKHTQGVEDTNLTKGVEDTNITKAATLIRLRHNTTTSIVMH